MLRTTKNMKENYEKIQNLLFTLIPEKWEAIYLYASVSDRNQNGEMFFYYIPKSILKKKPVNVYEVPDKFNINEEQYLSIVDDLYSVIKQLKQDFIDTEQDLWTSVTMSIANMRFKVEYSYDEIPDDEEKRNEKRIIWRYKHLKIGGEKKEERIILDNYYSHDIKIMKRKELYETGLYIKTENNNVMFDKEEIRIPKQVIVYEKEENDENISMSEKEINKETEMNLNNNDLNINGNDELKTNDNDITEKKESEKEEKVKKDIEEIVINKKEDVNNSNESGNVEEEKKYVFELKENEDSDIKLDKNNKESKNSEYYEKFEEFEELKNLRELSSSDESENQKDVEIKKEESDNNLSKGKNQILKI